MSKLTKSNKVGIFAIFVAAALVGSVATFGDNMVFASNHGEQAILEGQFNNQGSQCVAAGSGGEDEREPIQEEIVIEPPRQDRDFDGIIASCNNLGLQFQENEGNLALGQQ